MKKLKTLIKRVRGWSLKKKIFYGILLVILVFAGIKIFTPPDNSKNIITDTVKRLDLKATVLATGQVVSATDLDLSFQQSGIVRTLKVKVGDKVVAGQVLATLDQSNELAALTQARGTVAAARAKYEKILAGSSNEEIELAKVALANAKNDYERVKSQQKTLVANAYKNLLNSTPEATPVTPADNYTAPTISGSYNLDKEGDIFISTYSTGGGEKFNLAGLLDGSGTVSTTAAQPVGNSGLYIKFPTSSAITAWKISLPNLAAADYITNLNAYHSALRTEEQALGGAEAMIDQRNAELALKQASARPADIEAAQADILGAQGTLEAAAANLEHTILRAPESGTITKIEIKLGELAQALAKIMVLEDVNNLYLEANINEVNIKEIKIGAPIDLTFDALGPEIFLQGKVLEIEPSSSLVGGVVNYKITGSVEGEVKLLPGMTANMTILASEKKNVLAVPARAVIIGHDGGKIIRLVTEREKKTYEEVPIQTGLEADGGLVEILSGALQEGDEVVLAIKK